MPACFPHSLSVSVDFFGPVDCFQAGGSVMPEWSSGWEGLEDPWLDAKHQYHLRLVLTKETLSSPDGDVLRYIADEVYKQLFCSKVGPKPDSQTWSDYVTETCVCKHRTWFRKHGIGYPEMAMLVKVLDADTCQAGHNAAPRPPAEVANALVRKLGEEWEALWAPVRLSD